MSGKERGRYVSGNATTPIPSGVDAITAPCERPFLGNIDVHAAALRPVGRGVLLERLPQPVQLFRVAHIILRLKLHAHGLENRVAVGGQLESVIGEVGRDAAAAVCRVVEVIAVVQAIRSAGEDGEKLRRVKVIAPVEERARRGERRSKRPASTSKGPTSVRPNVSVNAARGSRGQAVGERPELERSSGKSKP